MGGSGNEIPRHSGPATSCMRSGRVVNRRLSSAGSGAGCPRDQSFCPVRSGGRPSRTAMLRSWAMCVLAALGPDRTSVGSAISIAGFECPSTGSVGPASRALWLHPGCRVSSPHRGPDPISGASGKEILRHGCPATSAVAASRVEMWRLPFSGSELRSAGDRGFRQSRAAGVRMWTRGSGPGRRVC